MTTLTIISITFSFILAASLLGMILWLQHLSRASVIARTVQANLAEQEEQLAELQNLLVTALSAKEERVYEIAIQELKLKRAAEIVRLLLSIIDNNHPAINRRAVNMLVDLGVGIAEPLTAALSDQSIGDFAREAAIKVLGDLRVEFSIDLLVAALHDEKSIIREAAADALGKFGERASVEPLVMALEDEDALVRRAAVAALAKLKDRAPIEPLARTTEDSDDSVAQTSAVTLGKLGIRALEALIVALRSKNSGVRWIVAIALGRLGDARAVEPLITALQDDNHDVREAAVEALGQLKDARAVEPLIAALQDDNHDVRKAAVEALGRLNNAEAVVPLIATLKDSDQRVRKAAEQTIEHLKTELAVQEVKERLGTSPPAELLVKALLDSDPLVRRAAKQILEDLRDPEAAEIVVAALHDDDKRVRQLAAEVLGKMEAIVPIEPLVEALSDPDTLVRQASTLALEKLGERAVKSLLTTLNNSNNLVRATAVEALGKLGEQAPIAPLVAALDDQDESVRDAAVEALVRLGDRTTDFLQSAHYNSKQLYRAKEVLDGLKNQGLRGEAKAFTSLPPPMEETSIRPIVLSLLPQLRTFSWSGEAILPEKVYVGTSHSISLVIKLKKILPKLLYEEAHVVRSNTGKQIELTIQDSMRREQRLEVELLAAGMQVDGEKKQEQPLTQDTLSYHWNCAFPASGNQELTLILRIIRLSLSRELAVVHHTIKVTKFAGLTQQQLGMITWVGGVASFVSVLIGIFNVLHLFGLH